MGISNPSSIYYGHAVLWQSDLSTPIELGDLNWGMSYAADINNSGQVVGNAVTYANINGHYSSTTHATLWESGSTTAIDLNTLVSLSSGYLREAMSINDKGQIIAIDSNNHINLLTPNVAPIPIPATIWLFGSTLAGFIGFNRRQKMQ
ncbi:MAG: hypothetical protein Q8Q40_13845 [Methylococcaceae bacterium]|nr:hypothetical protein [Methylococcaceae bacterium]MDP3905039.1 hypothetical protein [Methylococcaceae bacterium]